MHAQPAPAIFNAIGMHAHRYRSLRKAGRVGALTDDNGFSNSDPNAVDSSPIVPGMSASNSSDAPQTLGDLGLGDALGQVQNAANAAIQQIQAQQGGGATPPPAPTPQPLPPPPPAGMATWKKVAIGVGIVAAGAVIVDPKILHGKL